MTRRTVAWRSGALALTTVAAVASCAPTEVVLAEIPALPEAGRPAAPVCLDSSECGIDSFCSTPPGCGTLIGRCERATVFCDNKFAPVCGCDGATYWNDCLRRQRGAQLAAPGECTQNAARCVAESPGGPTKCPAGAACGFLSQPLAPCGKDPLGVCWVLPDECKLQEGAPYVEACDGSETCIDVCTAIRSGLPVQPATKPLACGP